MIAFLGIFVIIGIAYLWSANRQAIAWRTVVLGIGMQAVVGFVALVFPYGLELLKIFGDGIRWIIGFARNGAEFVFGKLASPEAADLFGFQLALTIIPVLIFLGSISSVLIHWGILQRIIHAIAWLMQRTMKTTAIETLSAAANVFLGQIEAPLLVRRYLPRATKSELFALMVGGFATIAGSMLGVYVSMGLPADILIISGLMAAPGGLAMAKLAMPASTVSVETDIETANNDEHTTENVMDAVARGAWDGFKVSVNVVVVLLAFKAFITMIDAGLAWSSMHCAEFGWTWFPASVDQILGVLFTPFAWLLNIPGSEVSRVATLLGVKLSQTEFLAYDKLAVLMNAGLLSERTVTITTVALCGFANVMSIGIQIGGLGMMVPDRRTEIASIAFKAMCIGALTNLLTACFVSLYI